MLAALTGTLKRASYDTIGCASAQEGLRQLVAHEQLDLVFCDLMMKGMTGMELHTRLMQELPGASTCSSRRSAGWARTRSEEPVCSTTNPW